MAHTIIDGKMVSQKIKDRLKVEVDELYSRTGQRPGLAVILVGDDKGSQVYVNNKEKACKEIGIYSQVYRLHAVTTQEEVIELITKLNNDKNIHGILVQSPLPPHIDPEAVTLAIEPRKDVDCFHPFNVGKLCEGKPSAFLPCTPAGIITLLKEYAIPLAGKDAVVVGRSNIVGKPMALMLLAENCTVSICHSKTKDLSAKCAAADILVVAIGRANMVTGDMVKEGAVVIDVGMNRNAEGKLTGDVDFATASGKASAITPVPGGVGPMTIATLMENTVRGFKTYCLGE